MPTEPTGDTKKRRKQPTADTPSTLRQTFAPTPTVDPPGRQLVTPYAPPIEQEIALDLIDQGEQLIRANKVDDEISELALDIAANGLLQPIGVRQLATGRFQLLYGGRRLAAHQQLKRQVIRATIHADDGAPVRATAIRENLIRRQLSLQEECDAVRDLHEKDLLSPDQIASRLSRSRAWVLRRLSVHSMPVDLREPLLDGTIALNAAETLALIEDEGLRAYAYNQTVSGRLTNTQVRELVRALQTSPNLGEAIAAGIQAAQAPPQAPAIYYPCAHCGEERPAAKLILIRICAEPCAPQLPHGGPTNGDARNPTDREHS